MSAQGATSEGYQADQASELRVPENLPYQSESDLDARSTGGDMWSRQNTKGCEIMGISTDIFGGDESALQRQSSNRPKKEELQAEILSAKKAQGSIPALQELFTQCGALVEQNEALKKAMEKLKKENELLKKENELFKAKDAILEGDEQDTADGAKEKPRPDPELRCLDIGFH